MLAPVFFLFFPSITLPQFSTYFLSCLLISIWIRQNVKCRSLTGDIDYAIRALFFLNKKMPGLALSCNALVLFQTPLFSRFGKSFYMYTGICNQTNLCTVKEKFNLNPFMFLYFCQMKSGRSFIF